MKKDIIIIDNAIYKATSEKAIKQMIIDLPNQYALSPYQLHLVADVYIKALNKKRLAEVYNKIAIAIAQR